ncbi:MAG: NAD(P)-binding domain-containing protein [Rhodobacteraceae bacterium]|nr:NAD(P)-binding domain-containing protein [Paracoccaceae bacterium]
MQDIDTVVIGAGQAGLATSHELKARGVEHVVLERGQIGQGWRDRWDSFCLVTPNWSVNLPGFPYDGDDPDGFMPRDEIVAYLERYAESFDAPVRTGISIASVGGGDGSGFAIGTDGEEFQCRNLVLATGAFQKPLRPSGAESLPDTVRVMDLGDFTSEADLPPGDVLIVGSGQSGCQIAEELTEAGRRVVLACGRAPWALRRAAGKDLFWWLEKAGFFDTPADAMPEEARLFANVLATGHDGGHDLHLRSLQAMGVELVGRFKGADASVAKFAPDLAENVAWGDVRYAQLRDAILATAEKLGVEVADLPEPEPFQADAPTEIDLTSFGTVLFTGGFRPDFSSWLPWSEAFDGDGFPLQSDGASTVIDGLFFVGVHFMRKRKSALLYGVGEDAGVVSDAIAAR